MLFLLFIGLVVLLVRHGLKHKELIELALATTVGIDMDQLMSPIDRCNQMQQELGIPWGYWEPEKDEESNFTRPRIHASLLPRYLGPLNMEVAGDQVQVYDMQFTDAELFKQPRDMQVFQTVISIKPPELNLPSFVVRPKKFFSDHLTLGRPFETGTALDTLFEVESLTPMRVKALFQSEYGTRVLVPFILDHNWTIEWNGKCFITYEVTRLCPPALLAEVALEVSVFFDLLKSGTEVIDEEMKRFIDLAVAQRQ